MTIETIKELFKFSWSQVFSDQNGKTSVTSLTGFILSVIGGIGFLYSLFLKDVNGMMYAFGFAGLGAGLLGYNKKVNGKPENLMSDTTSVEQTTTTSTTIQEPTKPTE